jgi:succinoglycan biosynthesis transport protein ExoP
MQIEQSPSHGHGSTSRAVRHHLAVVVVCLVLGGLAGFLYGASLPSTYTSSTRVLVNPSAGNPFAPTPASVRQDQQTSLETEAQVARSAEVLGIVAAQGPGLTTTQLERGVRVNVPANTQIIEISFSASDRVVARQVADAVATAYLANRQRRFDDVNAARIQLLETQTLRVVEELRAATAAAQVGSAAKRDFHSQLADALRNELVGLRAQRTSLDNSESPPGAVISPASAGVGSGALLATVTPFAGGLAGLALGCLLAVLLERWIGKVRSGSEVEAAGLPVLAAVAYPARGAQMLWRHGAEDFEATIRRLRGRVLELPRRPDLITVAPLGGGRSDGTVAAALAESFAKAGHRVVLVRTEGKPSAGTLAIEDDGLAEVLVHERLSVLDVLQPSVEPLLSLLPPGRLVAQSRELLGADRLREALEPLVEAGHLVVIQSPGIDTVEGEAIVGAADLGLLVVNVGRSRPQDLASVATRVWKRSPTIAAVVVGHRSRLRGATASRFADDQRLGHVTGAFDLGEEPVQVPPTNVSR